MRVLTEKNWDQIKLKQEIITTLNGTSLNTGMVIEACQRLSDSIGPDHLELLMESGMKEQEAVVLVHKTKQLLSREYLMYRVKKELGGSVGERHIIVPPESGNQLSEFVLPLGVLFHITAGNMEGLAFASSVEGLLTGNINLIKPSGKDSGLSKLMLEELIRIEPLLEPYLYYCEISSKAESVMQYESHR